MSIKIAGARARRSYIGVGTELGVAASGARVFDVRDRRANTAKSVADGVGPTPSPVRSQSTRS